MKPHRIFGIVGLVVLLGAHIYCWQWLAPAAPWAAYALNPAYFAFCASTVAALSYAVMVMLPERRERLERLVLASFLAAMPFMYIWGALRAHDGRGAILEAIGVVVYGGWAVVGYRRSSLLIGAGIAAHGIGWDAWRHGHAGYMEPWYPVGCLIVDIAFGVAIASAAFGTLRNPRAETRNKSEFRNPSAAT